MKKLLFLTLLLPFFFSCSDDPAEETQEYTSYVIKATGVNNFGGCLTGYFNEEGKCILLHDLGSLDPDKDTEEFILPEHHNEIYLFSGKKKDFALDIYEGRRLKLPFKLKIHTKNLIYITEQNGDAVRVSPIDETNWPH